MFANGSLHSFTTRQTQFCELVRSLIWSEIRTSGVFPSLISDTDLGPNLRHISYLGKVGSLHRHVTTSAEGRFRKDSVYCKGWFCKWKGLKNCWFSEQGFLTKIHRLFHCHILLLSHWNCQSINLLSHPLQLVRWWCCMVCKVGGRSLSPPQSPQTLKIIIGESGSRPSPSHLFCS